MSATTRTAFILAALFSTLLLIVSIMGFAGTIAKKLVFVRIYAYFLYFHFVLNIAIAIYLMYQIVHAANTDVVAACERVTTEGTKAQCSGLFKIAKQVYFAVAGGLLIAELCEFWSYCYVWVLANHVHRRRAHHHSVHASVEAREDLQKGGAEQQVRTFATTPFTNAVWDRGYRIT
jgi:hypothetical protein